MTNKNSSDAVKIWVGFGFTQAEAEQMEAETQREIPTDEEAEEMIKFFSREDENETFDKAQEDC